MPAFQGDNFEELTIKMATNLFTLVDFVVLGASFVLSALIGIYFAWPGRRQNSPTNYFLGDRQMGVVPIAISYMATAISAVAFIGIPSEVYFFGPNIVLTLPGRMLAIYLASTTAIPIYYRLKLTSIYEYLELRFDNRVKVAGLVIYYVFATIYMGFVVYAPALALSLITGMSVVLSIVVVTFVCIFYTTIGGMKAVIWTDVLQAFLMMSGLVAIAVGTFVEVGGVRETFTRVRAGGRALTLDFEPDITIRYSVYSSTLGGFFSAFTMFTTGQPLIQRCLCCKSVSKAQTVVLVGFFLSVFTHVASVLAGLGAYAFYADCDPRREGRIQRFDQLVPLTIGDIFGRYPGVSGFIVSGAFSASLSTISSNLNSMTAVMEAALLGRFLKDTSDKKLTFVSKIITLVFGLLCTALALLATKLSGVLEETIALLSILVTPLSAIFFLGFFVPRCNAKGALCGLAAGIVFGIWIKVGSEIYPIQHAPPLLSVAGCPSVNVSNEDLYVTELYTSLPETDLTSSAGSDDQTYSTTQNTVENHSIMVKFYNMSLFFYSAFTFTVAVVGAYIASLATKSEPCRDSRLQMSILEPFYCGGIIRCLQGKQSYEGVKSNIEGADNDDGINMTTK